MKKDRKIPQFQLQAVVWAAVAVFSAVGMYVQLF